VRAQGTYIFFPKPGEKEAFSVVKVGLERAVAVALPFLIESME
jgi:hypothetical protein